MLDRKQSTPFLFFADKWLQKQRQAQLQNVSVRDILITQSMGTKGEFGGECDTYYDQTSRLANETDNQLISRIITHIQLTCLEAREIHLNDNFINPKNFEKTQLAAKKQLAVPLEEYDYCKIQIGCENNVTRVIYNEFSFYPYFHKGPFTLASYNLLVTKLSMLAENYPDNMHIIVATLPVLLYGDRIVNVAIHIQCGIEPVLQPFMKAVPSKPDSVYEQTRLCYPTAGGPIKAKNKKLGEIEKKIVDINRKKDWGKLVEIIDEIKLCSDSDDEYRYIDAQHEKELPALVALNITCENILRLIHENDVANNSSLREFAYQLLEDVIGLRNSWKLIDVEYFGKVAEMISTREATRVYSGDGPVNITQYQGGLIECKTYGGVKFITIVDICLDQRMGVGAALLSAYMETCLRTGYAEIPEWISYVVTSNTVNTNPSMYVANDFTQCDPFENGRRNLVGDSIEDADVVTKLVELTFFGSDTEMSVYPQRMLSPMRDEFYRKRERYNAIIQYKQRLQLLETQALTSAKVAEAAVELQMVIDALTITRDLSAAVIDPTNQFNFVPACVDSVPPSLQNADYIAFALKHGLNPNLMIADIPLLHWSIMLGFVDTALLLMSADGVNLLLRDQNGNNALELACRENLTSVICALYNEIDCRKTRLHFINHYFNLLTAETKTKLLILSVERNRAVDAKAMLRNGADSVVNPEFLKMVYAIGRSSIIAAFYIYSLENKKQWALPGSLSQKVFDAIIEGVSDKKIKNEISLLFPRLAIKNVNTRFKLAAKKSQVSTQKSRDNTASSLFSKKSAISTPVELLDKNQGSKEVKFK